MIATPGCGPHHNVTASKLSRIENGRSRPDLSDIFDLLDLYGVTGADREKLIAIGRDAANTRGWCYSPESGTASSVPVSSTTVLVR